jgi:uncharacterized protein (DUF1330 family)
MYRRRMATMFTRNLLRAHNHLSTVPHKTRKHSTQIMTKGYLIAHVKVNDADGFSPYQKAAAELLPQFDGKLLVKAPTKGESVYENANGVAEESATVVLEFSSLDMAVAFYESDEYQAAKKLREPYSESTFVLVPGVE